MANLPRKTPFFSLSKFILSNSDIVAHSSLSFFQPSCHLVPEHNSSHSGCSGDNVTKVAPNIVSGRVVKT